MLKLQVTTITGPSRNKIHSVRARPDVWCVYNGSLSPHTVRISDLAWRLLMDHQFDKLRDAICDTEDELSRFRKLVINSVMATVRSRKHMFLTFRFLLLTNFLDFRTLSTRS